MTFRVLALGGAALAALTLAAPSSASTLIDRNATAVRLSISQDGKALLTWTAGGRAKRVLAWGAINALAPTRSRPQVEFQIDYSGGPPGFRGVCRPYDGPPLPYLVTACKAPDGTYWRCSRGSRCSLSTESRRGSRSSRSAG